jgi:hypothetical protein
MNPARQGVDRGAVPPETQTTEITVTGGDRYHVEGDAAAVERRILDAARGSIMEFAWLVEIPTGQRIGLNPEAVISLRSVEA